jgi:histidinol-phosphate phosphatase family protein
MDNNFRDVRDFRGPDSSHFVFLDRDGVINVERGDYTTTIEQWQWAPGVFEGIKLLTEAGFRIIVITNQACIAKGLQSEEGLAKLHDFMLREIRKRGGDILRVYHCPHQTGDDCSCRKPAPGMILQAAEDYRIDLGKTFMIGDSLRDMEAGRRAGTRTIHIDTGMGADSPGTQFDGGDFRADDLLDAARIVMRETEETVSRRDAEK